MSTRILTVATMSTAGAAGWHSCSVSVTAAAQIRARMVRGPGTCCNRSQVMVVAASAPAEGMRSTCTRSRSLATLGEGSHAFALGEPVPRRTECVRKGRMAGTRSLGPRRRCSMKGGGHAKSPSMKSADGELVAGARPNSPDRTGG